jgi:hypothetical protein
MNPTALTWGRLARDARRGTAERCDLCGVDIPADHRHLLEVQSREIQCVCRACAVLFQDGRSGGRRYRLIPDRRLHLAGLHINDVQWEHLGIPVGLAFIIGAAPPGRVTAYYPSPMGPTEASVPETWWRALVADNPILRGMLPDVEALLANRARGAREYYLVPIEECFRLTAVVRTHWRGLSGGQELWHEVRGFFDALRARSIRMEPAMSQPHEVQG